MKYNKRIIDEFYRLKGEIEVLLDFRTNYAFLFVALTAGLLLNLSANAIYDLLMNEITLKRTLMDISLIAASFTMFVFLWRAFRKIGKELKVKTTKLKEISNTVQKMTP